MDIAIIGTGNVGGALAANWASYGHRIRLGVRDQLNFKGKDLLSNAAVTAHGTREAVGMSAIVLIAAPPQHISGIISEMGDVRGKVVIDAMNSVRTRPEGFAHSYEVLKAQTHGAELVKCFNTTGYENMLDPMYQDGAIDMFMAGDSAKAKEVARQLALDAGFANCYDFGGDDKVALLEQLALCWINLAIMQGEGRDIAFRIVRRK